jgi:hypothetical protein
MDREIPRIQSRFASIFFAKIDVDIVKITHKERAPMCNFGCRGVTVEREQILRSDCPTVGAHDLHIIHSTHTTHTHYTFHE